MLHEGVTCSATIVTWYTCPQPCWGASRRRACTAAAALRTYMGQFCYEIMHIPGQGNNQGHLVSRWSRPGTDAGGEVPGSGGCHTIVSYVSTDADYVFPLKNAIKISQMQALAAEGPEDETTKSCGTARCDIAGLFRMSQGV